MGGESGGEGGAFFALPGAGGGPFFALPGTGGGPFFALPGAGGGPFFALPGAGGGPFFALPGAGGGPFFALPGAGGGPFFALPGAGGVFFAPVYPAGGPAPRPAETPTCASAGQVALCQDVCTSKCRGFPGVSLTPTVLTLLHPGRREAFAVVDLRSEIRMCTRR